jgi:hypothetical protein
LFIAKLDKSIISTDKNILPLEYTIFFQVMTRFVDIWEDVYPDTKETNFTLQIRIYCRYWWKKLETYSINRTRLGFKQNNELFAYVMPNTKEE